MDHLNAIDNNHISSQQSENLNTGTVYISTRKLISNLAIAFVFRLYKMILSYSIMSFIIFNNVRVVLKVDKGFTESFTTIVINE